MATWAEMSLNNYEAAILLLQAGHFRSCISRAYYSVYAAVTAEFAKDKNVQFAYGLNNPSHDQLVALAANNLDRNQYRDGSRQAIARALKQLQRNRIAADYVNSQHLDKIDARQQMRNAGYILNAMGVR